MFERPDSSPDIPDISPFKKLIRRLGETFVVRDVMVPLTQIEYVKPGDAERAEEIVDQKRYSVVPISGDGKTFSSVFCTERGPNSLRQITTERPTWISDHIPDSTSLAEAFFLFDSREWYFTLRDNHVSGLITYWEFNSREFRVAMKTKDAERRSEVIRSWLSSYAVFQGIDSTRRDALAKAVLDWADRQPEDSRLETLDALVRAHADLMAACSLADGRGRNFTSLASKALWLRYPYAVPLYDRFAQDALWMLSKLETNLPPAAEDASRYAAFALIWRALYDRYAPSIAAIDNKGYPYQVRIFDRILWLIGEPVYGPPAPLRS